MGGQGKPPEVTARQVIDLVIALAPVAIILAIQYRDHLKRAQMWVENVTKAEPELTVPAAWVRELYDDLRREKDAD